MTDNINVQQQYGKLSALVDHVLTVDLDLPVSHYFQRYLAAAKFYVVQLKIKKAQEVKTVLLDVSDVNTCSLPIDFVSWVKIGEQWGQYVRTLSVNRSLNKLDRDADFPFLDGGSPGQLPNGVSFDQYGGYAFTNYNGVALFGLGGGLPSQGHFTIKECPGGVSELLLDANVCTSGQIYLEYIGIGINPCGETILHPTLWDCVRRYLLFWDEEKKKVGRSETAIQRLGRDLWTAEMEMRACSNLNLSPDDIVTLTRQAYRVTNKI